MGIYQLYQEQKLKASRTEIWDFISSPGNLKKITPPYMGFDITSGNLPEKMYPGMIISYKVSPLFNFKMNWVTEITQVREKEYFVDEQRVGPYKLWHHQHHIYSIAEGVLMTDLVTYSPPFGFLGSLANHILIKKQLNEIFEFRREALKRLFGEF